MVFWQLLLVILAVGGWFHSIILLHKINTENSIQSVYQNWELLLIDYKHVFSCTLHISYFINDVHIVYSGVHTVDGNVRYLFVEKGDGWSRDGSVQKINLHISTFAKSNLKQFCCLSLNQNFHDKMLHMWKALADESLSKQCMFRLGICVLWRVWPEAYFNSRDGNENFSLSISCSRREREFLCLNLGLRDENENRDWDNSRKNFWELHLLLVNWLIFQK